MESYLKIRIAYETICTFFYNKLMFLVELMLSNMRGSHMPVTKAGVTEVSAGFLCSEGQASHPKESVSEGIHLIICKLGHTVA